MSLRPENIQVIRKIVRDRMVQSGVDNYIFVDGQLKIGSSRYAVDACGCGEPECDGVRLRRVQEVQGSGGYLSNISLPGGRGSSGISPAGVDGTA